MNITKNIVFGDSYSNVFNPLKNTNFEVCTYDGAMIKGLINLNDKYNDMVDRLEKNNYDNAFFIFGTPDCIFYYYKKVYVDGINSIKILDKMVDTTIHYVKLISELKNIKHKYILGVMPPHVIRDDDFYRQLQKYGIIKNEKIKNSELKYSFRLNIVKTFNDTVEKYCKKYNIIFCNIFNILLNKKNYIDKLFRTPSKINIHSNFDYILIVYLNTCLRFLLTDKNKQIIYKNIINSHNEYVISLKKKFKKHNKKLDENENIDFFKIDIKKIIKSSIRRYQRIHTN
jgi:hypothetical protein